MSRLRLAVTALVLAVFAGVVGMQILVSPSVVSADIGGGRAGPRGSTGPTGPTGPNWTTCAELASSMTNEVGTCGSLGGPLLSASPTTTGTLTAAGISAVTGAFSAGATVTQSTTNGTAITATGNGSGVAGAFVGGASAGAITAANTGATTIGINVTGTTSGYGVQSVATTGRGLYGYVSGNGIAVMGEAVSGGYAFLADVDSNGSGYGLKIQADTTSPTWPGIRWDPGDTVPSTASAGIGDLFMFTGGYLLVATATGSPATYNSIGGFFPVTTGVTAFAGGGQASATAICASAAQTTVATVASAGDSVKFPATPVVGQICRVKNKGANSLNLFPGSGDAICNSGSACGAADAALAVAANAQVDCYAESAATWNCK